MFQLSSGAGQLDFDIQGNVSKDGARFGTWSVTPDNRIGIAPLSGGPVAIDVDWGFNPQNQLELRSTGAVVFNFHLDPNAVPEIQASAGVLFVAPDLGNRAFLFQLRGDWAMTSAFDLEFTAGGVTSTIGGILEPSETSEFIFVFDAQGPAARQYKLAFTGAWQQREGQAGLDVDFVYDREPDQPAGIIHLPPALSMEPEKNMLVYAYDKGGDSTSVTLAGNLQINPDFSLTYTLDSQSGSGLTPPDFSIGAVYRPDSITRGAFHLEVDRSDGKQVIQVGGTYSGVIAGVKLTVGFNYQRTVCGTTITDLVALNGQVLNPGSGNQFHWAVDIGAGGIVTVDITAQITLSPGKCIKSALNVTVSGRQVALTAMFGIPTGCRLSSGVSPTKT